MNPRLVTIAGHLGDRATVAAARSSTDPRSRIAALGASERLSEAGPDWLVAGLDDPDQAVVCRALEVAARTLRGNNQIDAAVLRLLNSQHAEVVEVAAWTLGERHGDTDGVAQSIDVTMIQNLSVCATGHEDALCREAAVAALGSIGDERGRGAVLAAMADKATVRRRAVIALSAFSGPEVDAALAHAQTDRDWQVRQAAEDLR